MLVEVWVLVKELDLMEDLVVEHLTETELTEMVEQLPLVKVITVVSAAAPYKLAAVQAIASESSRPICSLSPSVSDLHC